MWSEQIPDLQSEKFDWLIAPAHGDLSWFAEGFCKVGYGLYGQSFNENPNEFIYGFYDKSGTIAINPRFAEVEDFSDGLSAASVLPASGSHSNLWGYIDKSGEFLIEPAFNFAESFSEGLALVSDGEETWCIDKKGESKFLYPDSQHARILRRGFAISAKMKNNRMPFINWDKNRFGYLNSNGDVAISNSFTEAHDFSEGYAVVGLGDSYAFIDINGSRLGDQLFTEAESFENGFANVKFKEGANELSGCLNSKGEIVAIRSGSGEDYGRFSNGLCAYRDPHSELFGYKNLSLEIVIEPQFLGAGSGASQFSEGFAWIREQDRTISLIDELGERAVSHFPHELIPVVGQVGGASTVQLFGMYGSVGLKISN